MEIIEISEKQLNNIDSLENLKKSSDDINKLFLEIDKYTNNYSILENDIVELKKYLAQYISTEIASSIVGQIELINETLKENNFDLILESVGLEITRHQAINSIAPGGTIVHIGLTQPSGTFNFKKLTIQEVTLVGTYCYTNDDFKNSLVILKDKKLGDLGWIEYRDLKKGSDAFQEIHNGTCVAPKIILIP